MIAVSGAPRSSVDCVAAGAAAVVVPNTVNAEYFTLPPAARSTRPFVFVALGDLVRGKRIDLLIRPFAHQPQRERDTRLVIVSDGKERLRVQQLANALVTPSDFETFGVMGIEAIPTGLPVIATRCGARYQAVAGRLDSIYSAVTARRREVA